MIMKVKSIILLICTFSISATISCWDTGIGPYESEKEYCKIKKEQDDPLFLCLMFSKVYARDEKGDRIKDKNGNYIVVGVDHAGINNCLIYHLMLMNECEGKSIYKRYWW
ncbi:MAG: hypothetical protein H7A25_02490 [Leptospiraceae bacterium]|nr:hypothetical protein [Leptospiraceae bacterium]